MSDRQQPDEPELESESNPDEPTLDRRTFFGVGAVAIAGASGLGLAQRNSTDGTNGSNSGGNGKQSTSGKDNEGSEQESGSENESNEKADGNEKNDENEKGGGNEMDENDVGSGADHRNEGDESVSKSQVSLSEQEARDAATKEVNGTVQSVELGSEDGTPSYEVLVENGKTTKEVAVDANSGKVLKVGSED